MPRAVILRIGQAAFLAETDDSVVFASDLSTVDHSQPRTAADFETVVDLKRAGADFVDVKEMIVKCCNSLHEAIANIPNPEKVAVEFGIKLIGETGIPMLTKASGEANFKISVEWKTAK